MINLKNLKNLKNLTKINLSSLHTIPEEWKDHLKEVKENVANFIRRDRKKDKKIVSPDLTNPTVSSQEIALYDYN